MTVYDQGAESAQSEEALHEGMLGARVADALAMPAHWYYDTRALDRDYGAITFDVEIRPHGAGSYHNPEQYRIWMDRVDDLLAGG